MLVCLFLHGICALHQLPDAGSEINTIRRKESPCGKWYLEI